MSTTWSADEIRRVGHSVVDAIADHLSSLPDRPVFRPVPPALIDGFFAEPAPESGGSPDEVLQEFLENIEPYPFGNGHPRFWGWVNSPPLPIGVFADALAAAMNPSCAGGNHAAIYVERQVIAWLKSMLGLPAATMGLLVSGGSMATLTALAVARHLKAGIDVRERGLRAAPRPFRVYQSAEGHSCIRKAVEILGLGSASIVVVPVDHDRRMKIDALDAAIERDLSAGFQPIAVVGTAGTVNTGAIDPIAEIAAICRRRDLWLHVDAAYGGPAILTDEYAGALKPLAQADSVALDPHKWMYVPVEAGCVLVRDAEALRATFSLVPPYIRAAGSATGVFGLPWFSEYGAQQTRGFKALKIWMCLKLLGLEGYRKAIAADLARARELKESIEAASDFQLVAAGLSVVCFRYAPPGISESDVDAANRSLLERLQLGGEAFLTSTELDGRFVLRACMVNHRSTDRDIQRLLAEVRCLGRAILPGAA